MTDQRVYELYICPICGEQQPPGTVWGQCSQHPDTDYEPRRAVLVDEASSAPTEGGDSADR